MKKCLGFMITVTILALVMGFSVMAVDQFVVVSDKAVLYAYANKNGVYSYAKVSNTGENSGHYGVYGSIAKNYSPTAGNTFNISATQSQDFSLDDTFWCSKNDILISQITAAGTMASAYAQDQ